MVVVFVILDHGEHTILPSRKRLNKGMKRMNSLLLSPGLLLSFLMSPYRDYLQVVWNTVSLNSYLGLFAELQFFLFLLQLIKDGNPLPKHFERSPNLLDCLNVIAFMKPNEHKKNSKDFSTTWPNLF